MVLALLAGAAIWLADTSIGHRFIADRIAALSLKSGLKIRVGRIDGSIYGKATIQDLRLSDDSGLFFEAGNVALDWRPWAWAANKLDIESLTAPTATLHRMPKLVPSDKPSPILPDFDIRVGHFDIARLTIGEAIVKPARVAHVGGRADIHNGRALVDFAANATGGDRLALKLDAQPDRNVFDVSAMLDAPSHGVIGGMIGTDRPLSLRAAGDGNWTNWRGKLAAQASGQTIADLALHARSGRYDLDGVAKPSAFTNGRVAALTGPQVRVKGNARLEARRLDAHLALASSAIAFSANGIVDLASSSLDGMRIDARLLRPQALLDSMTGRDIALKLLVDGPFKTANFDYLLTAPRAAFGTTGFEDVRASGRGRLSSEPVIVPLKLTARRVTGLGEVAGGLLNNLSVDGLLRVTTKLLTGDGLMLKSDKLTSTVSMLVDFATGRYDVSLTGQLGRYYIPGLGIVDVKSTLNVVPGPNGIGTRVVGRGQAWVRRLDNAFLGTLAGGLPRIDTALERSADGIIRFTNLRLVAPAITLTGSGYRRLDGTFFFQGSGRQARYGPLRLTLDGPIDRPKIDLHLARPLDAAGLRDVHVLLAPTADGFTWRANGGSMAGPFDGNGAILLPKSGAPVIRITRLVQSGITVAGDLRSVTGGLDGTLTLSGGGVSGNLMLAPVSGIQRIEAHLGLRDMRLAGPPVIAVQRGTIDAVALLDPAGVSVDATVSARGLRRGNVYLERLAGNAKLRGGQGEVRAAFAGGRGRLFDIQTVMQIAGDRVTVTAQGTLDRKPISLDHPAVLTREASDWRLDPATVSFAGGAATVSGRFGDSMQVDAVIERMSLTVLDLVNPDLGLGGTASGRLGFVQEAGSASPTGHAELRVRGLTRAGLATGSQPIDAGINALLRSDELAFRAIAVRGGQSLGQAQGRVSLAGGSDISTRIMNGPLFAQVRYNGPADTLWRLTGVESLDVSGPIALAADFSGRLTNPVIQGSMRTDNLRVESPLSGTVLTGMKAAGVFNGSRLVIDNFTANAGRGTVTGRAAFDLGATNGLGIDISADAKAAQLIERDDLSATATGPLRIRSDGQTGVISGNVILDRSAFRLGQAAAVAQVPHLNVREINLPAGTRRDSEAAAMTWTLDVKASAPDRMAVTGLGLDSEWRADLAISGAINAPRILGRADVVRGGYEFAGKRFELSRGVIRFQGEYPPDPVLDITANASVSSLAATITVTGTGQRPQIAFTSTPALPQEELLSRLLFGTSITNLSAAEAFQLGAAVASLQGGGGLDPINAVRRAIGLDRLRIVGADASTGAKTSVAAGKYLTRRTYVEVVSDGQGYSATRVEFAITRWLSLISSISTIGKQSISARVSKDY